MKVSSFAMLIGSAVTVVSYAPDAGAHDQLRRHYDLPAQDLKYALRSVARRVGYQLVADSVAIRGKRSRALLGNFTVEEAITVLIKGMGLSFEIKDRTILVRPEFGLPRERTARSSTTDI